MMIEIINCRVEYKSKDKFNVMEEGVVTEADENKIRITTPTRSLVMQWSSFLKGTLKLTDESLQEQVLSYLAEKRRKEEELKKQEEEQQRLEALRNNYKTLIVFQGKNFGYELNGKYIAAPIQNEEGRDFHHWRILEDIIEEDLLFNCSFGEIKAVSVARGKCQIIPDDTARKGCRKVSVDYVALPTPLEHGNYRKEIVEMCTGQKQAPFDKHGKGIQGYCFELTKELARFFMAEILKDPANAEKLQGTLFNDKLMQNK